MLYDMKAHIPNLMDKMMLEDYRAGDITKLETDKTLLLKLFADNHVFVSRVKAIDDE